MFLNIIHSWLVQINVVEVVISYLENMCSKKQAFNVITNKDEVKVMAEHISCDCKSKFNSATCNSK